MGDDKPKPKPKKPITTGFDFASTFKQSLNGNGNSVATEEHPAPASTGFDFAKTFQESIKKKPSGSEPTTTLPEPTSKLETQLPLQEDNTPPQNRIQNPFSFDNLTTNKLDNAQPTQPTVEPYVFGDARSLAKANQSASDNLSTQQGILHNKQADDVIKIQENQATTEKMKPIVKNVFNPIQHLQQGEQAIETDQQKEVSATQFLKTDLATPQNNGVTITDNSGIDPTDIAADKNRLAQYGQQRVKNIGMQIAYLQSGETGRLLNRDKIEELQKYKSEFQKSIDYFAQIHAGVNGTDAIDAGIIRGKINNDQTVIQADRFKKKGLPVNDATAYNIESQGLQAKQTALDATYANRPKDEAYYQAESAITVQQATLFDRHPEYLKQQWAGVIGNYLSKDIPAWQKISGLWTRNIHSVIDDMRKDGYDIPKDVEKNIRWNDVPDNFDVSGKLLEGAYSHFSNLATGIERIAGTAAGMDKDVLDKQIEQGQATNEVFATPTEDQLHKPATLTDKATMLPVSNPDAGKINPTATAITGEVFKGLGGFAAFMLSLGGTANIAEGAIGKVLPEISGTVDATKLAHDYSLGANVVLGGYEGNYQKAQQIIGDHPEDEGKRSMIALTNSLIDYAVFKALPTQKYTDALIGGKQAATDELGALIKNIPSDLKGLNEKAVEGVLKKNLLKPLVGALEVTAAFGGAQQAGIILHKIAQTVISGNNDESAKDWDTVGKESKDMWASLPLNMLPGVFGAEVFSTVPASNLRKESMYQVSANPTQATADVHKAFDEGIIKTEAERDKRIQVINTGASILAQMPDVSPVTGKPFTHNESVAWVNNRIKEVAIEAKKNNVKDDKVLEETYDAHIKKLQAERYSIMTGEFTPSVAIKRNPIEQKDISSQLKSSTDGKGADNAPLIAEIKELNITGTNIELDKPQRADFETDQEYADANMEHNKNVDNIIGNLKQEGTLTDNQGKKYGVTITSQGVRVINLLSDGTEGEDVSYRKGKRLSAETPFTNGFKFEPKPIEAALELTPEQNLKDEIHDVAGKAGIVSDATKPDYNKDFSDKAIKVASPDNPQGHLDQMDEGQLRQMLEFVKSKKVSEPKVSEGVGSDIVDERNKKLVEAFPNQLKLDSEGNLVENKPEKGDEHSGIGKGIFGYHEQYWDALKNNTNPKELDSEKLSYLRDLYNQGKIKSLIDVFINSNKKGREINSEVEAKPEQLTTVKDKAVVPDNKPAEGDKGKYEDSGAFIAEKIRSGKINKLGGFKASTGFDAVWDGSLEAAAKVFEASGKAADALEKAIEAGLKHFRESDWYKSLTDKKDFEDKYRDHLNKEFGEEPPIKPPVEDVALNPENPTTVLSFKGLQEIADEFGLDDVTSRDRKTDKKLLLDAQTTISKWVDEGMYHRNIENLVKSAENREVLTDEQRIIVQQHLANVRNAAKIAREKFGINSKEFDKALLELKRVSNAGMATRSAAGAALRVGDIESAARYDIPDMMTAKMEALNVNELTESQKVEIEKRSKEIESKLKTAEEKVALYEAEIAKYKAEAKLSKTFKSPTPTPKTENKTHNDFVAERQSLKEKLKKQVEEYKAAGQKLGIASDGNVESFILTTKMAKTIGEIVKSHVEEIGNKLSDVVNRTFDDVKDLFDGITEKHIHDVIAGKYNEKQKTKNQLQVDLKDLHDEAKLIDKLEILESGQIPRSEKGKIDRNQKIKDLRDKIKGLTKELSSEEKEANKFYSEDVPDEIKKLKAVKKRNEIAAQNIKDKISKGEFDKEEKEPFLENQEMRKRFPKQYKEAMDAIIAKDNAKHDFEVELYKDALSKRSKGEKVFDKIKDVIGTTKALRAGIDFSALMIQNIVPIMSHPIENAPNIIKSFREFASKSKFERSLAELHNSKYWELMQKSGLDVTEPKSTEARNKEEIFNRNLLEKDITIKGKKYNIGKYTTAPFERAFTSLGNAIRVSSFLRVAEKLEADGYTFENNPEIFKKAARLFNTQTGRGTLPEFLNRSIEVVNVGFWSPKLMTSRLNLLGLGDIANPLFAKRGGFYRSLGEKGQGVSYLQRRAALDMVKFIGGVVSIYGVAAFFFGADPDLDPRSTTFGDIKEHDGPKSYNMFGGFSQYVKLFAILATGQRNTGSGKADDVSDAKGKSRADLILKFLRGKVTPVAGVGIDILDKKDYLGKPINVNQELLNLVTPLALSGIPDDINRDGLGKVFVNGLISTTGINVKDERDYAKKDRTKNLPDVIKKDFERTKDEGFLPPNVASKIVYEGHDIKLDDKQLQEFSKMVEDERTKLVKETIESDNYKQSSDAERKSLLQSDYDYGRKAAKTIWLEKNKNLTEDIDKKIIEETNQSEKQREERQ